MGKSVIYKGVKLDPAQLPPEEQESTTAVRLRIIKREGETEEHDKKDGQVSPSAHHHPLGVAASRGQCQPTQTPLQKQTGGGPVCQPVSQHCLKTVN